MKSMKLSFLALGASFLVAAQAGEDRRPSNFEIVTLSNRADLISGGDALVELRVPKSVALSQVRLSLNGRAVTGAVRADPTARVTRGVRTGIVPRRNDVLADSNARPA